MCFINCIGEHESDTYSQQLKNSAEIEMKPSNLVRFDHWVSHVCVCSSFAFVLFNGYETSTKKTWCQQINKPLPFHRWYKLCHLPDWTESHNLSIDSSSLTMSYVSLVPSSSTQLIQHNCLSAKFEFQNVLWSFSIHEHGFQCQSLVTNLLNPNKIHTISSTNIWIVCLDQLKINLLIVFSNYYSYTVIRKQIT